MGARRSWGTRSTKDETARLRQQIEGVERDLFEREAELVDLRAELYAFQLKYDAQVGHLADELEEIEAEIERCQRRVRQQRQWGRSGLPVDGRGTAYVPVEEQYRQTWQEPAQRAWRPPEQPVSPAVESQIKVLYRQLCRRFHPDLTQDEGDRAWRTERMAAINAAYAARDLAALRDLSDPSRPHRVGGAAPTTFEREGVRQSDDGSTVALGRKLQRMQQRLRQVEDEIRELMDGELMALSLDVKFARRRGNDLLGEMAETARGELERKRVERDLLQSQLRQLGTSPFS